jgi:hypothetical protein
MNTYTIGRRPGKTICYSNPEVSNDHAEIVENNGSYTLIDHSTNGTLVNGNRVHNASFPINRGDIVMFAGKEVLNWNMIAGVASAPVSEPEKKGTNVFAILGFIFAFVVSPLGLVFSIIGLATSGKYGGKLKGMAIAGLIISIIFTAIWLGIWWGIGGLIDGFGGGDWFDGFETPYSYY